MTSRYSLPEQLVTVPRLAGLVVHRDGPVLALRQELSSDGKRYFTHPWAVPRDSAPVQLTHGDHGVQEVRPAASGAVWFTSERPVAGDEDKRTRLWLLPEEALFLMERWSLDLWWPTRAIEELFPPVVEGAEGEYKMAALPRDAPGCLAWAPMPRQSGKPARWLGWRPEPVRGPGWAGGRERCE